MKEPFNKKRNPLNKRFKAYGLIILILLMLFSTSPVAGSEAIQYELVASTTSDAEGNYLLSGIPDGNYTLVALYNEDKWRRADEQIQVQGMDLSVNLDTSSRDIDANESQALLDLPGSGVDLIGSAVISGLTRQKQMGGDPTSLGFTNVLLLREMVTETPVIPDTDQQQETTSPAAGNESIQYELVASTTSDAEGNYLLSGIPDGNYTLVALYNEDKWRRADEQIQVQGPDLSVNLDTSSRDIDANESQTLLDLKGSRVDLIGSAKISGLTRQKQMGGDPITLGLTDVLLLRKMVTETPVEDINNNGSMNLTLSCFMADYVMENDVDLSGMDIIYINMLSPSTAQKLTPTVDEAIASGCVVIDDDTLLNESIPLSADQIEGYREKLNNYWLNGAYDQSNLTMRT